MILGTIGLGSALLAACSSSSAEDVRVSVVVSAYPLEEAALRVGGERVSVLNLTPPGAEPHELELTSDDLQALSRADLVVYLGGGFQPSIEDALDAVQGGRWLDVLPAAEPLLPGRAEGMSSDPHVWLDPVRYSNIVGSVAGALAEIDPEGEEAYLASAEAFFSELRALDSQMRTGLASCQSRLLVTGHVAFAYLADAYELEQVGIAGVTPESEPGPERLAEIRDLVKDRGVATVFAEAQLPADTVEAIAFETGALVATLDPLETLIADKRDEGEGYVSVMLANLEALEGGLGCG